MTGFSISMQHIAKASARLQTEYLEDFRNLMRRGRREKADDLEERLDDIDPTGEYADVLADEKQVLVEIQDLADEMAIIGLYRIVELNLKKLALHLYSSGDRPELRNTGAVRSKLKSDYNLDINNIGKFEHIDELRVLNNAIKHQREVTEELAKFDGWTEGNSLENLDDAFNRLKPAVQEYLENFGREIDQRK